MKGTNNNIKANNIINKTILLEKYSTKKPYTKPSDTTPKPGPQLILIKGKEKEVLFIKLPISSSSIVEESLEDDNNNKEDNNKDAITQVSIPISKSRQTILVSARNTKAPTTLRPDSSNTSSKLLKRSSHLAKRVLSSNSSPYLLKRTKEN
ncbi:unnamed protein product [Diplocarpon coronariae]